MRALLAILVATAALAAEPAARVLDHHGQWESGYGERFYNIVGQVKNTSPKPLGYIKLRVDALDDQKKVVASTETYNESASGLAVPDLDAETQAQVRAHLKPIAPGAEETFRAGFLKTETPPFTSYRVTVVETPVAP